jgi:flagellar protein FlaG
MSLDVSSIQTVQPVLPTKPHPQPDLVALARREVAKEDVMKTEPSVTMESVLKELSQVSAALNKRLSFSLNEKLDMVVVKVIDTETDKVIREIPAAEVQHVHERIREVIGLLFDETA